MLKFTIACSLGAFSHGASANTFGFRERGELSAPVRRMSKARHSGHLGNQGKRHDDAFHRLEGETETEPRRADQQKAEGPVIIHHLKAPQGFAVGNEILDRDVLERASPRVFCYAFVKPPEDYGPEKTVSELKKMLSHCDGSALYSNYDDPTLGITKAHDGPTGGNAKSSKQFLSVYEMLARSSDLQAKYDWFVDLESDHFVRPKVLKPMLASYNSSQAIMVTKVNVRILSTGLLRDMMQQWSTIGQRRENGCPVWGPPLVDNNCQGDVTLELIPAVMSKNTAQHGFLGGTFFDMQYLGRGWEQEENQVDQMNKFVKNEWASGLVENHASGCPSGFLERLRAARSADRLTKRVAALLDALIANYFEYGCQQTSTASLSLRQY